VSDFDVLVLGSGPGGQKAAIAARPDSVDIAAMNKMRTIERLRI
jgi:pyruvate/2-oxoglutarate dehydrogenase complex dihydrolipoamide dehydrogenase (E3) component